MKVEIINPIEFHKEETQTEMMMTNFHFITLAALTSETMDEVWSKLERVTNHSVYEIRKSETHCQVSQRDTGKVILFITEAIRVINTNNETPSKAEKEGER